MVRRSCKVDAPWDSGPRIDAGDLPRRELHVLVRAPARDHALDFGSPPRERRQHSPTRSRECDDGPRDVGSEAETNAAVNGQEAALQFGPLGQIRTNVLALYEIRRAGEVPFQDADELGALRFKAPALSPRQIRRRIYG